MNRQAGKSKPIGDQAAWLEAVLARAWPLTTEMNDFHARFIDGFRIRFDQYRDKTLVSPKQLSVLREIERNLDRREAET